MASYHMTVKSGAKGGAASHAAYISREDKYSKKEKYEDLEHKQHGNMPSWAQDKPVRFWQAADTFERANGATYREFEIALPREFTAAQRQDLVNEFVNNELGENHAYQYAIHNPKAGIEGEDQPHAHIMFCERINDGIERDPEQFFKRANAKKPEQGGARKARFGECPTERKAYLVNLRERWADLQNQHLETHGHTVRVDHRSLKEQGINRAPESHFGPGRVRDLSTEQASTLLELRAAERELTQADTLRDSLVDLSGKQGGARAAPEAKASPAPQELRSVRDERAEKAPTGTATLKRDAEGKSTWLSSLKALVSGSAADRQKPARQREKPQEPVNRASLPQENAHSEATLPPLREMQQDRYPDQPLSGRKPVEPALAPKGGGSVRDLIDRYAEQAASEGVDFFRRDVEQEVKRMTLPQAKEHLDKELQLMRSFKQDRYPDQMRSNQMLVEPVLRPKEIDSVSALIDYYAERAASEGVDFFRRDVEQEVKRMTLPEAEAHLDKELQLMREIKQDMQQDDEHYQE